MRAGGARGRGCIAGTAAAWTYGLGSSTYPVVDNGR